MTATEPLVLTGFDLTAGDVADVARGGRRVELAPEAVERMALGWDVVREAVRTSTPVYGLTTGVGAHKRVSMDAEQLEHFNLLLLPSHRVGQGPYAPADVVRAALLRLVNGFASGTTGVRPELAAQLVEALNGGETPGVRMLGSLGQADLAPMADLAHGVIGDFPLTGSETLSLVNSNAFSTAIGTLALADCHLLMDSLDVAGALDLEAFAANLSVLHPAVARVRPYPGIVTSIGRLRDAARRELPVGRRRRPIPPGSAHVPEPRPGARRGPRCPRPRRRDARHRAERVPAEPARSCSRSGGSSRSRTTTSCRSPPRSTSSGSRSHRS